MTRFIITRTLTLIAGLAIASVIIFLTLRLLPGDVAQIVGGTQASPERLEEIREQMGLNVPLWQQYAHWVGGLFTGDLGTSILTGSSIASEILQKSAVTVPLTIYSLVIGLLLALPLGVIAAYHHRTRSSQALSLISLIVAAVPVVWGGMIGIMLFSSVLGWLPSQGFPLSGWSDPLRALRSLTLPALTIGLIEGAILYRFVKSATLTALDAPHVRTAMSRGRTRFSALISHGLPSVGLSIVSMLGLQVASLLVGAVVIEQLFNLPGLGRMLVTDVGSRDLMKVQSTVFVLTAVILVLGALIDMVHRLIDPRLIQESR